MIWILPDLFSHTYLHLFYPSFASLHRLGSSSLPSLFTHHFSTLIPASSNSATLFLSHSHVSSLLLTRPHSSSLLLTLPHWVRLTPTKSSSLFQTLRSSSSLIFPHAHFISLFSFPKSLNALYLSLRMSLHNLEPLYQTGVKRLLVSSLPGGIIKLYRSVSKF